MTGVSKCSFTVMVPPVMQSQQTDPCVPAALLPVPFATPPTLKVHSQDYPCVFVDHIGHADSWDDLQQVGGNSSIESGHTLLGHDVPEQGQHGGFRGSFH